MVDQSSNDNDSRADGRLRGNDPHGQASLLLVESLIHGLVARSIISVSDAIEIIGIAADAGEETAADFGPPTATIARSLTILETIRASLALDLPE